jgi:hypothetical protein
MPNPEDVARVLDDCISLLRQYAASKHGATCERRLLSEFHDRLVRLLFAFRRITELAPKALEAGYEMAGWRVDKASGKIIERFDPTPIRADMTAVERKSNIDSELFILTEWFYYTAWRLREIIHAKSCDLPGLCGFEAEGVRDVRNHVLQHPENYDLNRQVQSTAVHDTEGPMLGVGFWTPPTTPFRDRGLYNNALEFATNLKTKLSRAVAP